MGASHPDWGELLVTRIPPTWATELGDTVLDRIRAIGQTLSDRAQKERIVPHPADVFRALSIPPDQVRVLIVGQDPYPTPGHAMGLAFSVPRGVQPLPPTARNIHRELVSDLGIEPPTHGDLSSWASQGVLLLNRYLTGAAGTPGAHRDLGWSEVTDRIVHVAREKSPQMVAIIWGKAAEGVAAELASTQTIRSAHPSPLSAHRGFFGSQPFSRANALLVSQGLSPINWSLPEGEANA